MAVVITVAATDRTTAIDPNSVQLQRNLTSQPDSFRFAVIRDVAGDWKPSVLDIVVVQENSVTIFGGQIIEINEEIIGGDIERVNVVCKDYTFLLDRELVADTYENMSVAAIVQDIITNYTTGFTYTNVVAPPLVDYIAFKYEYPSKCLQQLAELIGYDWYVDENKDIHFFAKDSRPSPFNLTDDNGTYYYETLRIKKDAKNLRNTIVVRGGTFKGTTLTESQVADGDQLTFLFAYKYSSYTITVDAVTQDVGLDNIDDPADHDCLYNFNEKALKFPDGSQPTAGQVVALTGLPHLPVIVRVKDPASIAQYGAFEFKVVDKSLNSKESARSRAEAELRGWADEVEEGGFDTKESGLAVGQTINVQSTKRSINQDFVISKISSGLTNGQDWLHRISLVTTQTFGMIEFLQRLLVQKDKEIEIDSNEIVDLVESFFETITVTDTVANSLLHNQQTETVTVTDDETVQALDYAVEFVVSPVDGVSSDEPTGTKRVFLVDYSYVST